ncbi:hypothetical protein NE562_00300 [Butyricicoccus faecihominis]|uniref:hypothetical protein n=1 Tax=Butyricicoccus faecihominis TaxID=1712515 RepID=UPI00247AB5A3|nr:hypothetical protein [Butyricicoccus faecihominis]MCQ5128082.1 hypothetical protein [Butyricicoccus faecihominis]
MEFKQSTLSELREELKYSVENLLIDLFVIDCFVRCPAKEEWNTEVLRSSLHRADAFLKQHTDDVYSVGKIFIHRLEEEAASA